jgi:hypothetical protein
VLKAHAVSVAIFECVLSLRVKSPAEPMMAINLTAWLMGVEYCLTLRG